MESNLDQDQPTNDDNQLANKTEQELPELKIKLEVMDFDEIENAKVDSDVAQTTSNNKIKDEQDRKIHIKLEDETEDFPEFLNTEELTLKDEQENFDEDSDNDDFDLCQRHYAVINDNPTPMGVPDRAAKTVPKGSLELRPSPSNVLGIFALRPFQKGVQFGPYEGKLVKVASTEGYSWKLNNGKLVNEGDATDSNYFVSINCARDVLDQNLEAFQHRGEIYYRTCRDVMKDEELLIYFDNTSGDVYYKPPEVLVKEEIYTCQFCHVGLNVEADRDKHQQICRFGAKKQKQEESIDRKRQLARERQAQWRAKQSKQSTRIRENCRKDKAEFDHLRREIEISIETEALRDTERNKLATDLPFITPGALVKSYACRSCDYITNEKGKLSAHKSLKHRSGKMLKCPYCDYEVYSRSSFYEHKRKHDRNNVFQCRYCSFETFSRRRIKSHENCMHEKKVLFKCTDCAYESYEKYSLSRHRRITHERIYIFKCTDCDFESHIKSDYNEHKHSKHGRKNVSKSVVLDETCDRPSLDHESFKHEQKKLFKCADCEYETHVKSAFYKHRQKCYIKNDLNNHINVKRERKDIVKCLECDYESYNKNSLKYHIRFIHNRKDISNSA